MKRESAPYPRKRNVGGFRNLAHRRGKTIPGHCSWPPIVPLPRNRLAVSATGGASPVSPRTPLKRPDQGGPLAPLFWTSSPGDANLAAAYLHRVAAAGQEGQIALDYPEPPPALSNAGKHLRTEAGGAHPAGDFRTLSELLTNNSRIQANRSPNGARICAQAFSFPPGAAAFLWQDKEKRGRIPAPKRRKVCTASGATPAAVCRKSRTASRCKRR